MRKGVVAVTLGLLSGVAVPADTPPAIPKAGNISYKNVFSGSVKALALGKDQVQVTYDVMGVSVSDTGEGALHNASVRCMGALHVVNGSFDDESGSCVYTRPDGDQAFTTYKGAGKQGVDAKGTATFVGGTGKLVGIKGSIEWTRTNARPAAEGTVQSVVRHKGTYQLPP